jgi:hypothetical protein
MRCAALRVALHAIGFAAISRLPVLHCGLLCVRQHPLRRAPVRRARRAGRRQGRAFCGHARRGSQWPLLTHCRRSGIRRGRANVSRMRLGCARQTAEDLPWRSGDGQELLASARHLPLPRASLPVGPKGEAALRCCRVAANSAAVQRHERKPQECPTLCGPAAVQRTTGGCVRQDKRLARRLAETTGGDDFVSSMFLKERPRRTPNAAVRCSAVDAARARIACPCTHSAYRQPRRPDRGCVRSAPPHAHVVS